MRPIDADALKAWVEEQEETKWGLSTDEVWDAIDDAPTIEPKKGKWDCSSGLCVCNNCGKSPHYVYVPAEDWNYCPNCGAKMDAEPQKPPVWSEEWTRQ